jgi:acetyl esterase
MRRRGLTAVRQAIESAPLPDAMPEMAIVEDCASPGPAGPTPLRIYRPTRAPDAPVLVYFHGGGMVLGSNHSFEPLARTLASVSNATVVAVDYRLAPENPPPAQFDDAYSATAWVADNADRLGVDSTRLAVIGDSAGGSLAAAVALAARDHDGPAICCQVLLYPGLDRDMGAPSITAMADAPMLSVDDINYMHALADSGAGAPHDGYRVPAYACDLSGLPPAIVVTGECDPIRDWGERYAARLREARVQTTVTRYPGMYHGFLMRCDATARGRLAIAEIGGLLRAKFAHPLPF